MLRTHSNRIAFAITLIAASLALAGCGPTSDNYSAFCNLVPTASVCQPQPQPAAPGDADAGTADAGGSVSADAGTPDAGTPDAGPGQIAPASQLAVWANEGGDKVTRDELRLSAGKPVTSAAWDGSTIKLSAARNETVSFNLVLEAPGPAVPGVTVAFSSLVSGTGAAITGATGAAGAGLFDYKSRDIELFYVRYLQIKGLSVFGYGNYDERHIPERMRRPFTVAAGVATASGGWTDRPDHDKFYPDIAVPLELVPTFTVAASQNQSVWADIYVSTSTPPGTYLGTVTISESGVATHAVPVQLVVHGFTLPDVPASKTMLVASGANVARRYTGRFFPASGGPDEVLAKSVGARQAQMAHRHRVSMVNSETVLETAKAPSLEAQAALSGALFDDAHGYRGPGIGVGTGVYSIGTYGIWKPIWGFDGVSDGSALVQNDSQGWVDWFAAHPTTPPTKYFLYLEDEPAPARWSTLNTWASWVKSGSLRSMVTVEPDMGAASLGNVSIFTTAFYVANTAPFDAAVAGLRAGHPEREVWYYNGQRPATGTMNIEDDGVAMRMVPWAMQKKGYERFMVWSADYYYDDQGRASSAGAVDGVINADREIDLFQVASTIGAESNFDPVLGNHAYVHTNGCGVLMYPGTDAFFPASSYGIPGPIASLRLKHWRRGLQDADYIALAAARGPAAAAAAAAIVAGMVPVVLQEVGVASQADPTYQNSDIGWTTDPEKWEAARAALAAIIEAP